MSFYYTTYKILTSILAEQTYVHMNSVNLFPIKQKGSMRGSYECKDQLLFNYIILANCISRHKNLSTAWFNYKKVFDSAPHSWILITLQLFKVSPVIQYFVQLNMTLSNIYFFLSHSNGIAKPSNININNGIFQGDSFSPLLFCISLIPV